MAEPKDIVVHLLREIQAELSAFRKESDERFSKLEGGQKNLSPESYIRELVEIADLEKASIAPEMGHLFDLRGRIRELEMKVRDLETHK